MAPFVLSRCRSHSLHRVTYRAAACGRYKRSLVCLASASLYHFVFILIQLDLPRTCPSQSPHQVLRQAPLHTLKPTPHPSAQSLHVSGVLVASFRVNVFSTRRAHVLHCLTPRYRQRYRHRGTDRGTDTEVQTHRHRHTHTSTTSAAFSGSS